jgi:site-specific DNA recombinase
MKVGLYLRVSTQEQAKEGYSIGEQESRLKDYSKAMRWDIHKVYVDPGYSGADINRPALQDLISDVEEGKIDKVVVYKLDRLSRSQLDTLFLIEKVFLANDCDFVSMTENFDTSTPFGRAMIGILAVFAQLERERIKERMMMGKEARAKEGGWNGGRSPIGYEHDKALDKLILNEYEAMQVKELFDLFVGGNHNLRDIERIFLEKGYRHKYGAWDPKSMRRVLRSKLYTGQIFYQGKWYKSNHTAFIDEHTHEEVVKILDARAEAFRLTGIKPGVQTTFLGGLLYCKHCGGKYTKQKGGTRSDGYVPVYYVCYSRGKKVKKMIKNPNCKNKGWRMQDLDNIVFNEIRKLAANPDKMEEILDKRKERKEEPNRKDIILNEIKKLDAQISRFMDLYGTGAFTIEQVSAKVEPLNEQKQGLLKELKKIDEEIGAISIEEAYEYIYAFDDALDEGNFETIRALIDSLIFSIELDNDTVTINWKFA